MRARRRARDAGPGVTLTRRKILFSFSTRHAASRRCARARTKPRSRPTSPTLRARPCSTSARAAGVRRARGLWLMRPLSAASPRSARSALATPAAPPCPRRSPRRVCRARGRGARVCRRGVGRGGPRRDAVRARAAARRAARVRRAPGTVRALPAAARRRPPRPLRPGSRTTGCRTASRCCAPRSRRSSCRWPTASASTSSSPSPWASCSCTSACSSRL